MKKQLILFVLLIVILFSSGCITSETVKETREKVLVTEVTDGDTITIQGGIRVRLLGIDAPEKNEKFYSDSQKWLQNLLLFKEIELESDYEDKDRYNRLLRWVWLEDKLVNEQLVMEGLAIAKFYENNEKYQNRIANAEAFAIKEKKGLWLQINQNFTEKKEEIKTIDEDCPYVASKNSDKFHVSTCSFAARIKKENKICFSSREEAIKRGYTACSICKP